MKAMKAMKSMKAVKAMKAVKTNTKSATADGVKKTYKKGIPVARIFDTTMTANDAAFLCRVISTKYVDTIVERERLGRLRENLEEMQEQLHKSLVK